MQNCIWAVLAHVFFTLVSNKSDSFSVDSWAKLAFEHPFKSLDDSSTLHNTAVSNVDENGTKDTTTTHPSTVSTVKKLTKPNIFFVDNTKLHLQIKVFYKKRKVYYCFLLLLMLLLYYTCRYLHISGNQKGKKDNFYNTYIFRFVLQFINSLYSRYIAFY